MEYKFVEYETDEYGRFFDIAKNLKKIWGVGDEDTIIGLKLRDRKNHNLIATVEKTYMDMGIQMIQWKEGGWNCLDHALEQFERLK